MNRIRTSIAILITIIILCISSSLIINYECRKLSDSLGEVIISIKSGNNEQAAEDALKLEDQWNSSRKLLSLFVNLSCLESADEYAVSIRPMIEADCDEAASQSEMFKHKLRQICRREMPYIYNIL